MTVTIGRRELLAALGGAAAAWPLAARAQQAVMPVVAFLNSSSPDGYVPMVAAFRQGFNSKRRLRPRSDNDVDLAADEVGGEVGKSLVLGVCPAVFDCNVLPLKVAGFAQALAEVSDVTSAGLLRAGTKKPDYWLRLLLRPRRERPCGRRTAEKC